MDIVKIVFVCHDDESIRRVITYKFPIIFVGNKSLSDEFKNNKDIIVARDLKYNIENEPKLLTFTAWYAIIKNDLFLSYKYICIFEYDVCFNNNLLDELKSLCNLNTVDVISFFPDKDGKWFWLDINKRVIKNFINKKNIAIDLTNTVEWLPTTNHCINRQILSDFIDWYYPDCFEIKQSDYNKFSWYHERCFSLFIKSRNIQYMILNGRMGHMLNDSHKEINFIKNKKYVLIYNDDTHKQHIDKLISSIEQFSDFIVIVYNKADIDSKFINDNIKILNSKRGGGYWLWKPYIIKQTLSNLEVGDYLFYIDSKYYFVENFEKLYSQKICQDDFILWSNKPNESTNEMKKYCKIDVIDKYNMHDRVYDKNAIECWAGAIFLKKTILSEKIIDEWLTMCTDYEAISDSPSKLQKYKDFVDHRHDQSLLSIVAYKYDITFHFFEKKYLQNVRRPW